MWTAAGGADDETMATLTPRRRPSSVIEQQQLQVFVRPVAGQTLAIDVEDASRTTVADVKAEVAQRSGVAAELQLLTFGLHALSDESTLEECGIGAEATISFSVALLGGAKKRKKKTYTKPKKQKHKKKKVKLSVLKFYKVDGSDKVTRLRKECPSTTCGAGVFMALHQNRTYCGRCGLTYIMKQEEGK